MPEKQLRSTCHAGVCLCSCVTPALGEIRPLERRCCSKLLGRHALPSRSQSPAPRTLEMVWWAWSVAVPLSDCGRRVDMTTCLNACSFDMQFGGARRLFCPSLRVSVCACVCVCKPLIAKRLSFLLFLLQLLSRRGAEEAHRALPNEALYGIFRILGLTIPTYLHARLSAEQL